MLALPQCMSTMHRGSRSLLPFKLTSCHAAFNEIDAEAVSLEAISVLSQALELRIQRFLREATFLSLRSMALQLKS